MYMRIVYIMFPQRHFMPQGLGIQGHYFLPESSGVEIAVDATRFTKGDVDVKTCHSIAHLLEGDFVETGIDIARGMGLSFTVWHDEPDFCNAFIRAVLTTYTDIGEWDEPSAGYACAAVLEIHGTAAIDFRVEVGGEAAIVVGNLDDIWIIMPYVYIVAELDAVTQYVKLYKSAKDAGCFALFKFLACTLAHNLHIDTRVFKKDVLILA